MSYCVEEEQGSPLLLSTVSINISNLAAVSYNTPGSKILSGVAPFSQSVGLQGVTLLRRTLEVFSYYSAPLNESIIPI